MPCPGCPASTTAASGGLQGDKRDGDPALRPALERPEWNDLTGWISKLAQLHRSCSALCHGGYHNIQIQPKQLVFERRDERERVLVAVNADSRSAFVPFELGIGSGYNLMTGEQTSFTGERSCPPIPAPIGNWTELERGESH